MIRISDQKMPEYKRRRRNKSSNSPSYLALAAFTIAGVYLVSSTTAFTTSGTRSSINKEIVGRATYLPRIAPVSPFGTTAKSPSLIKRTQLYASDGSESDKAEWRAILAALQMYKAAYGDLKVPMRFVVPSLPPWPEAAWEMKLGRIVGAIRTTGQYVDNDAKRRSQLDKLGFIWRARAQTQSSKDSTNASFQQIYDALVVYRREMQPSGQLSVPLQFSVPNSDPWPENTRGLPLGRSVEKITSEKFLRENPQVTEKLQELGLLADANSSANLSANLSANDIRFQNVYTALERYKEVYGDLLVPQPFEVPSDDGDWPEETWGLRLGARVNAIRSQGTFIKNDPERKKMLDDIGFVWSPPESERRRKGRKSKLETDEEEREAFEAAAKNFDAGSESQDDFQELDSLMSSFDFSGGSGDNDTAESIAPTWGFESGQALQDAVTAAQEAAAQASAVDEYKPERTLTESLKLASVRALEIGIIESGLGKDRKKGKQYKYVPWFNDDFGGYFVFDDVVEALTLYKKFYGGFSNLTNKEFVIPVQGDMPPFDDDDDDMDFMENDASARAEAAIARFEEFDDLSMTEDMMEAELSRLQRVISPDKELQTATATSVVPQVEVDWPEHLGGMPLGNIVSRIRDGSLEVKHLPERKARLDAIDFDWGDPKRFIDVPFEKAMCAMYAYYQIRGDMFVPADFVMLDDDPWPQALAGYELGRAVKRIRQLQNFFEAYHLDKLYLLRMVDFVWFPTLALPVDPDEPEVTPEMLYVYGTGHPNYNLVPEFEMGYVSALMKLGPVLDTDDPKLWWKKWYNYDYVEDIWRKLGRRDNAFWLRKIGFPKLADEHEEKYGPGLFAQIDESLKILTSNKKLNLETRNDLLGKLKYYRSELTGCRDILKEQRERLLDDIEEYIFELQEGGARQKKYKPESVREYQQEQLDQILEEYIRSGGRDIGRKPEGGGAKARGEPEGGDDYEYEEEEVEEEEDEEEEEEEEAEEEVEEDEYDLEDELGLESFDEDS